MYSDILKKGDDLMKFIGNILWFFFTGFWTAIAYLMLGILWCVTVIGIPFGLQAFKMAKLAIWPMGKKINGNFGKHPIANILWFIFGGFGVALSYLFLGLVWCVTVIGIPFGLQAFKMAKLAVFPFGATIE